MQPIQHTDLLIHHGELTTRPRLLRRGTSFVAAAVAWLTVFLVVPGFLLVALGFAGRGDYGEVLPTFTLTNYQRLLGYGLTGWSADYLLILLRSVWVAFVTTLLCVGLAYPTAFFIAARRARARYLWLALIVIPLCTNLVIRTYAWMLILAPQLPPARLAAALHLISEGEALYPGSFAVYLGMTASFLPFAILPIYTSVERIDRSLIEAANDLYATPTRVFLHAVLPQTMPGLTAALILTFIPTMGVFVVPDLLGGSKTMLVGNLIYQQFGPSRDWPFGAAISFGLMALSLFGLFLLRRRKLEGFTEVNPG